MLFAKHQEEPAPVGASGIVNLLFVFLECDLQYPFVEINEYVDKTCLPSQIARLFLSAFPAPTFLSTSDSLGEFGAEDGRRGRE